MSDKHGGGDLHYLGEQLQRLTIGNAGRRNETGEIEAILGAEGFIFLVRICRQRPDHTASE